MKFSRAESLSNSCSGRTEPQAVTTKSCRRAHLYDCVSDSECLLFVRCESAGTYRGREGGWATSIPHPRPTPVSREGEPDEESETRSPFIFITERQSALTLPVQPPSLSISLSRTSTRQGGESDKPTDR